MDTIAGAPLTERLTQPAVAAYLERIGHPAVEAPTSEALASLQDAHVRTVPFENLDISLGEPLSLELSDLVGKVVTARRGGFCFELNGLFLALLDALGYDVCLVEARSREEDGTLGPRFDHARILVRLPEGRVLVDVGNGASPRGPIRLDGTAQRVGHAWHRVRRADEGRWDSQTLTDGKWKTGWSFDETPRVLADFADRCHYHQTSEDSHFTAKPLCTLVTTDGQVTLSDRTLIITRDGQRQETSVDDPLAVLVERFGVRIPRWPGT